MKRIYHIAMGMLLGAATFLSSCTDNVSEDNYYTFTDETVASYCENRPSTFSVFSQLMKDAGEETLLASYGHYTAFIPTDSAFHVYFKENNISLESLSKEEKDTIIYNHIIRSLTQDYLTKDFTEGAISTSNMSNRYMVVSYQQAADGNNEIWINKSSKIISADNKLHNGVVHAIDKVLVPSKENLGTQLKMMADYSIFSEALELTHLTDSIRESYDMSYHSPYTTEFTNILGYKMRCPVQKKLGYTIFAEPNQVFQEANIHNLDDLVAYAEQYYGTKDKGNYTSRDNALNKFVSYHILDRQIATNAFIYTGGNTAPTAMDKRYEYYETMLKDRIMEIKSGNKINTLSDGTCATVDESKSNIAGMNGYIHCLNNILVYDEDNMRQDVLNKRIRFDAYSLMPEVTNNNIRWQLPFLSEGGYTVTSDYCGDHFTFNKDSKVIFWGSEGWNDYQADEISIRGWYDFTFRLLPVPPGTYELRLGYSARPWGGIAQLFVDNQIQGIPANFNQTGTDPQIGWVKDENTKDDGEENDKMMRNRGYMKGPNSILNAVYKTTLREGDACLRFIVNKFTWQDYGAHYFRAKNIESENGEFHLDYFELVPISYIENEGRD